MERDKDVEDEEEVLNPLDPVRNDDFLIEHTGDVEMPRRAADEATLLRGEETIESTNEPYTDHSNKQGRIYSQAKSFWSRYKSIVVIGYVIFVGDCSRGILFPVLWTLCQTLGGTTSDLGFLVAIFSLGRLIVTTPLGYFCDRYRHKRSLVMANVVLLGGSLLWSFAMKTKSIAALYFAQFLMGCGSGSLGVTRSYVVEACDPKDRTDILAVMTSLQYAGFTVSPVFGSIMSGIGKSSSASSGMFWEFALPAWLIALLSLYSALFVYFILEELPAVEDVQSVTVPTSQATEETKTLFSVTVVLILLNITTKGSIAVYETMASQTAILDYQMSSFAVGSLITGCGIAGFLQLLFFKYIYTRRWNDLQLSLGGVLVMTFAQMVFYSYGGAEPKQWQFIFCIVLFYGLGYPVGHTAVLGAFSKVQKKGKQAAFMGWFATAGSFSRILLPLLSGLFDMLYDNGPYLLVLVLLAISSTMLTIYWLRISKVVGIATAGTNDLHQDKLTTRGKMFIAVQVAIVIIGVVGLFLSRPGRGINFTYDQPEINPED